MRWSAFFVSLLVANTCLAQFTPIGSVVAVDVQDTAVQFALDSGAVAAIDLVDDGLARVRVNPTGSFSTRISAAVIDGQFGSFQSTIADTQDVTWLATARFVIAVVKSPFRVIAFHGDGALMSADMDLAVAFDNTTGLIQCRKYSPPNEAIFGLGLRGGPINRRGRTFFMRNTDYAGYGEFTDPLYQSYPLYYGLQFGRAYGLFLDSAPTSYFDVANTEPGVLTFGVLQGELDYYLIAGPDPQDISRTYGRLTGNNPLPPKWSLGYHHSRYGWQSEEEIRAVAGQLRAQDFPTDTLWFDVDYLDNRAAFSWNPATFPNPIQFHAELKAAGFRTIYINEPCIRNDDPLWPYMDALGYFLRNGLNQSHLNSIWFGNVSWIDFSNPIAYDWYKTQLRTFLSTGIDGLWNDLNEPANNFMPDAVHDFDGDPRSDTEARNIYALLANKLAYEAQRELRPNVRPWNFSRGGFSGIQRYAHTWGGDAPSTFDSLRVAIQTSISMGLSGQNQFGHDTGGFMGTPSAELFVRWLEFSLFTPLFRNHSINTAAPREPWVYGEPTTSIVRDIIKRRYRMIPYLYTLFEEASRTGRPVLMPIFFYGEDDESTFAQDSEYLFGPYLLVAPVSTPGAITRTLYLPAGSRWINFYTDQVYEGGLEITVDALLGSPPLFVREGGIVVQGEAGRYVDDPETSPDLTIDAYAIAGGFFTLYEDDGNSYDYTNGEYLRTAFQLDVTGSIVQCNAYRLDGTFTPPARNLRFQIHRLMTAPSTVTQNNTALAEFNSLSELEDAGAGWYFDSVAQLLVAIVADAPSVELQIE